MNRRNHMSWGNDDVEHLPAEYEAYVGNIGNISSHETLEEAKAAVLETIQKSGRADGTGYVMHDDDLAWEYVG